MLDCKNLGVIEIILSTFNVVFSINSTLKKGLNKSKYCAVIIEQIQNLKPNYSLCKTIYDLCFATIEKVNYLYPPNSSTVSSIVNRSSIADQIIKLSKNTSDIKKEPNITNLEILEILLVVLKKLNNDQLKFEIFRDLEFALDSILNH